MRILAIIAATCALSAQTIDWKKTNAEALKHFQALIQIDTSDPPGNETKAVDYLTKVLGSEGISYIVAARDPQRANLIARRKGNGSKRPLLIMGHTDVVTVDPAKWTVPPFSALLRDGYIYGRGSVDDKPHVAAGLMTLLLLKRLNIPLDRDVIFVAEAGEEAATGPGIQYLVNEHWNDIDAETCLAEGGSVSRKNGQIQFALIETAEKRPQAVRLVATGPGGHGSRPLRTNVILHLARAVDKVASWDPPMRFNDTTRYYFEKLAQMGTPEEQARYKALFDPAKAAAAREYLAEHEPGQYSMLHTSISPDIISGGRQINVIPGEAEATLDIRGLPDEDMPAFLETLRQLINDPEIQIVPDSRNQRPKAPPSPLNSEAFHALQAASRDIYKVDAIPQMSTGATDMAFLRAKGMQCYGFGPVIDEEDGPKGFGAHSDQERITEEAFYQFLRYTWEVVNSLAVHH